MYITCKAALRKWIREWRRNEIKSVQYVQLCNYMIIKNTTHGMKYLHLM